MLGAFLNCRQVILDWYNKEVVLFQLALMSSFRTYIILLGRRGIKTLQLQAGLFTTSKQNCPHFMCNHSRNMFSVPHSFPRVDSMTSQREVYYSHDQWPKEAVELTKLMSTKQYTCLHHASQYMKQLHFVPKQVDGMVETFQLIRLDQVCETRLTRGKNFQ